MKELSIIIPAYNSESWIGRCLNSCLTQNIPSDQYEIIVVNDGSKDCTGESIKPYLFQYHNILYFEKENGGLGSARNRGLKEASGEYILFLDSDDWLTDNSIGDILTATKNAPDVISIGYKEVYDNQDPKLFLAKDGNAKDILRSMSYPMGAPFWVVKRSFLLKYNLFFEEGILHEDNEFTPRMLYLAQSIVGIPAAIYNYYIGRTGSIISSKSIKKSYDLLRIIEKYMLFNSEFVTKEDEIIFQSHALLALNSSCANARLFDKQVRKELYGRIGEDLLLFIFQRRSSFYSFKYKTEGFVASISPKLLLRLLLRV